MKTKPIIFKAPMIQALREGRKTQHRRIVKFNKKLITDFFDDRNSNESCPYGKVGGFLWVKEAIDGTFDCDAFYCADENRLVDVHSRGWNLWHIDNRALPCKKISSIFMPRWASRLTLEITGVRVERLQDINEEDAIAEGVESWTDSEVAYVFYKDYLNGCNSFLSADSSYKTLWQSINGKDSWEVNPWVWVIDFIVHNKNIDEVINGM